MSTISFFCRDREIRIYVYNVVLSTFTGLVKSERRKIFKEKKGRLLHVCFLLEAKLLYNNKYPSVCQVYGDSRFSRPLIKIEVWFFSVQIFLIYERLFCKYYVRRSVGLQRHKCKYIGNWISRVQVNFFFSIFFEELCYIWMFSSLLKCIIAYLPFL